MPNAGKEHFCLSHVLMIRTKTFSCDSKYINQKLQMITITAYLMLFTSYLRVNGDKVAEVDNLLILYFGGQNRVPPMVNYTFGGETDILLMEGSGLFLNCSAHYAVKWITSPILAKKSRVQMGPKDNATNFFSIYIDIKNISTSDDTLFVKCISDRIDENANFSLSTKIRLKVSNGKYQNEVNAVESSMTRITTTNVWNILLYVTLRRRPLFLKNLKSRWFRRFMSPAIGAEGGEITKLVEHSEIRWTTRVPSETEFVTSHSSIANQSNWIPASWDLQTFINSSYGTARVGGGNYTVNVTDDDGIVYYSKEFELINLSTVIVKEIEINDFEENNMNDIIKNSFGSILQELSVDSVANIEYNKTYLIVCQFFGHPVLADHAFIFKNKLDCIPMPLEVENGSLAQTLFSRPTAGLSSDSTDCFDFTNYGSNVLLPVRTGNDGIILSALSTFTETIEVGCMYMPPNSKIERFYNDRVLSVSDAQLHDAKMGLSAGIIKPMADEIIVGDNVTLRCIAEKPRYSIVFWKLGEQYITDGDNPGPGYKIKLTIHSHANNLNLFIFNISLNQSISYTCRTQYTMWNYMTERDTTVQVNVQVPQTPDFGPQTTSNKLIKVTKGKGAIELYCDVQGAPLPKIKWTKTEFGSSCENTICHDNVTILSETSKLLNVPQHDTSYSGLYECIISNRLGTNKRQFRLEIVETGQERAVILIVFLAIVALTALILANLAIRYYKRSKLTRPLKALLHELQQQAKNAYADVKLDEALPTNEQTDVLPFDFRYEIAEGNFSLTNQLLGSGAFGQVHLGFLKLDDGRQMKVAVKSPIDGMDVNQQRGLLSEMKLMMHLGRHINVLALIGVVTAEMTRGILCAILEFCEFGSLLDYVHLYGEPETAKRNISGYCTIGSIEPNKRIENEGISNMDLLSFSYQIAFGMEFLSSKNIVHRDLALRNMLLTNQRIVKIADFGLALQAEKITDTEGYKPVKWMAIESICFGVFTKESDVWSYGIVLWELFTFGKPPYPDFPEIDNHFFAWLKEGNRMTAPDNCPPQIASLLASCWSECPKNRPSFSQCQQTVSMVADEISSTYWNRFLKLLGTIADDLAVSSYYNLNQIISIKREMNNTDILKYPNYSKLVSFNLASSS